MYVEPLSEDKGWSDGGDASASGFNPLDVGMVHCFRIGIRTTINDIPCNGYLNFNEGDNFKVGYTLIDRGTSDHNKALLFEYVSHIEKATTQKQRR